MTVIFLYSGQEKESGEDGKVFWRNGLLGFW
jgi:hypothetical protein